MIAAAVVALQLVSCLGLGAVGLRLLGLGDGLDPGERVACAFVLGFGVLGWLMFPVGLAGMFGAAPLLVVLAAGAVGVVLLRDLRPGAAEVPGGGAGRALMAVLAVVLLFDFMEGLSPPADTDSLAYHFANIKGFVAAGRIDFIPFPIEGAIPMLVQMTYVPVFAIGGEKALTLWTMTTGWAAGAVLYVLCRRHLSANWSLAVALVFMTTPTVIYGAGAGQVEVRNAMFVMMAALATARAVETGDTRFAALAGIGAGLFAGAKYTGLLFVAASGLAIVLQRRWLAHGAVFAVIALLAAAPWYAWNGIHTGDPVFPALFQWLGRDDLDFWNKAQDLVFKAHLVAVELPLPVTPVGIVVFPFSSTLGFGNPLGAGRVGFGPYGLLVLPFVVAAAWRLRGRIVGSRLFPMAVTVLAFYVLWFVFGGSQRVRHLLPVLPLFLVCVTAAARRWAGDGPARWPLAGAVAICLAVQIGGQALYSLNYAKHLFTGESREAFLARTVVAYDTVEWINANLTAGDRVFHRRRQLRYFLDVPTVIQTDAQGFIETRPGVLSTAELFAQFQRAGITHIMLTRNAGDGPRYAEPWDGLYRAGCLRLRKSFEGWLRSRTLPTYRAHTQIRDILAVDTCAP